jgi:hypothetical protein
MACSTQVQFRRGTTAQIVAFIGAVGEVIYDTQTHRLVTQDGVTAGGFKLALFSELSAYLPLAGGTVTGDLTVNGNTSLGGGFFFNAATGDFSGDNFIITENGSASFASGQFQFTSAGEISFFSAPLALQQQVIDITNNVSNGGTTDTIDDIPTGVYATDYANIAGNFYQIARKLQQIIETLQAYGLFFP